MKKVFFCFLILTVFASSALAEVRKAELAGSWYSSSKEALAAELKSHLNDAATPSIDGEIVAIISPHAGFTYSGPVAAYGFKAIAKDIKTVVIIGFSHRRSYDGIAVLDEDGFETPLGIVNIDKEITKNLLEKNSKIFSYPKAFSGENSVEMQIPFLQVVLKDFKVVLIAIGEQSFGNCRILGNALYETLKQKDKILLIGSTDLSHYLPYKQANEIDSKTVSLIKALDPDKLYEESLSRGHDLMCGYGAVCATMIAAKKLGAGKAEVLKYANSGDTAGDKRQVVGYLSAAIINTHDGRRTTDEGRNVKNGEKNMLNEEQRKKMLKLARDTIMHYLKEGKRLSIEENDPALTKEMGGFVTLHKHGELRGCIGNMVGRGPFYLTVRDMAIEAATGDPRFRRVTPDEMENITIEISVLSPPEKIDDPEKIEMGKHGVIVKKGFLSGVYLPQVAGETGWSREEFMNSLCGRKAGMAPDAWKKGECEIYIFTAEVFGEKN